MEPVSREGNPVSERLGLGQLVFVVGENEVFTAAVNVDSLSEIFDRHRAALDVPAGSALSPRAIPGRLSRLLRLPQREVEHILFSLVDLDSRSGLQVVHAPVAQFAVAVKAPDSEIDIALDSVGVATVD